MKTLASTMFFSMVGIVWQNAGPSRPRMILFYGLFILANILLSLQPVALAKIINAAQLGGRNAVHEALVGAVFYAGLTLAFWALHGPARVIERRVAFTVYNNFVTGLYHKVTEMPLRWHQDHHSGGTINRVNKAGKALFTFAQTQFIPIQTIIRFGMNLTLLFFYSTWVALTSVISSLIIMFLVIGFDKTLRPLIRTTNEREHYLNAALYDYVGNIITVLTLRLQGNTSQEIQHRFAGMKPSFWRETIVNEGKWGVVNILLIVTQAVIIGIYVALNLKDSKTLALGSVVAIFQFLLNISQLFYQAMTVYGDLLYQNTDLRGVEGLLHDYAKRSTVKSLPTVSPWKRIEIVGLNFKHNEGEDTLHHLRNIRLTLTLGQKIAFIGSSGSGKTTLLTLLRGLYEAESVSLLIDGNPFNNLQVLSGFTTLIPQDSEIFENTVRYNLTLGTEVQNQVVVRAIAITTFDRVVAKLPEGLDTDINERGVNLSGGQKQRLALARGLIAARDSSLLLLDEPTSSVDLLTESHIFDQLFSSFPEKTIIASIHRLHLLPRFDHIVLIHDGAIIEQGSYLELLAGRGAFYKLWQRHLTETHQHNVAESIL